MSAKHRDNILVLIYKQDIFFSFNEYFPVLYFTHLVSVAF